MALPTILPPDQTATFGAKSTYAKSSLQPSGFDKFLNAASYTAQTFGPLAYATTNAATGGSSTTTSQSGQIVAAAINSAASQSTGGNVVGGYSPSFVTTNTGSAATYDYTDGTSTGSTSGGLSGNVESILADTAASQAYLLGIQMQMGEQQTMFTSISNAMNVKHTMMKSVINNFRVG
jgi:hypothetical protein